MSPLIPAIASADYQLLPKFTHKFKWSMPMTNAANQINQSSILFPKMPREYPLVGYAPALLGDPISFLDSIGRLGNSHFEFSLFGKPMFVATSKDQFNECLLVKSKDFGFPDLYKNMATVIGNGITATPDGPYWKKKRLLLQPRFGQRSIESFLKHFVTIAKSNALKIKSNQATPMSVHQLAMDSALKSLFSCLFSKTFDQPNVFEDFRDISAIVGKRFWMPNFIMTSKLSPSGRRLSKHISMLDDLAYSVIDERIANKEEAPEDFLSFLLNSKEPGTENALTHEQIRDELINFIFAGYETTACLLSWALILLSRHQDYLSLARAEALRIGELNSFADFEQCKMIKAILSETLRLYPPVWVMIRQAMVDSEICGTKVKKGSNVLLSPYLLQRQESAWTNANEFNPSRFLTDGTHKAGAYYPFGHGPRHCLGNHFAMSEAIAFVFYIVRDFDIDPVAKLPAPQALITLQPPMDTKIHFHALS